MGKNMARKKSLKVRPRRYRNRRCGRVRRKTKRIVGKVRASRRIRGGVGAGSGLEWDLSGLDVSTNNDLIVNLILNIIYKVLIPHPPNDPQNSVYVKNKNTWVCANSKYFILDTSNGIKIMITSPLLNEIINLYRGWENTDKMARGVGWALKKVVGDVAFTLNRDLSLDKYDDETDLDLANRQLFTKIFTVLGDDDKITKALTALGLKKIETLNWNQITVALHALIKDKSGTDINIYKDKINIVFDALNIIQNFASASCPVT